MLDQAAAIWAIGMTRALLALVTPCAAAQARRASSKISRAQSWQLPQADATWVSS